MIKISTCPSYITHSMTFFAFKGISVFLMIGRLGAQIILTVTIDTFNTSYLEAQLVKGFVTFHAARRLVRPGEGETAHIV